MAENVRMLPHMLTEKRAIDALESKGYADAIHVVTVRKPELASSFWKQIHTVTALLDEMPLTEISAIRDGDVAKSNAFEALTRAVEKIKKELRK